MFGWYFGEFSIERWLGKVRCCFCCVRGLQLLLVTCGSLASFFSIESLEGFFQKYPRYFEGVPLGYKEFMFDVSCYTTRDMAELEVVNLSKSKGVEYSYEVFLFSFATFTGGEIGVQGDRCFGKRVLMLRVVVTHIAKSQLQGSRSRLR